MASERDGWSGSALRHSSMSCCHARLSRKLTTGVCQRADDRVFFVLQHLSPTCGVTYNKAHTPGIPGLRKPSRANFVLRDLSPSLRRITKNRLSEEANAPRCSAVQSGLSGLSQRAKHGILYVVQLVGGLGVHSWSPEEACAGQGVRPPNAPNRPPDGVLANALQARLCRGLLQAHDGADGDTIPRRGSFSGRSSACAAPP
jgi:hypothetical protein